MSEKEFLNLIETCDSSVGDWIDRITTIIEHTSESRQRKLVNIVSRNGFTPAHWACVNNNTQLLAILRRWKADLDIPTKKSISNFRTFKMIPKGTRPLHLAHVANSPDCANVLLHSGIDVNARDGAGRTAVFIASAHQHLRVLQYVCQNTRLKPNFDLPITTDTGSFPNGCNPLMAAAGGNPRFCWRKFPEKLAKFISTSGECTKLLLQQYVEINTVDSNGWHALHYACKVGSYEAVKYLCDTRNIKVDFLSTAPTVGKKGRKVTTVSKSSCLHILVKFCSYPRQNFLKCLPILIKAGVDPNARDERGWTAGMIACMRNDYEILGAMIEACWSNKKKLDFSIQSTKKMTINADPEDDRVWDENDIKDGTLTITFPKNSNAYDIAKTKDAFECIELIMRDDLLKKPISQSPDGSPKQRSRSNSLVLDLGKYSGNGSPVDSRLGDQHSPGTSPRNTPNSSPKQTLHTLIPKRASFDLTQKGDDSMSSLQRYVVSKIMLEDGRSKIDSDNIERDIERMQIAVSTLTTTVASLKNEKHAQQLELQEKERQLKEAKLDKKHAFKQLTREQLSLEVMETELSQEIDDLKREKEELNREIGREGVAIDIETESWAQERNKLNATLIDLQYELKKAKEDQAMLNKSKKDKSIKDEIQNEKNEINTDQASTQIALHPKSINDPRSPLLDPTNTNEAQDANSDCNLM